jgi:hypothetical protein
MEKPLLVSPLIGERQMTALMNFAWCCYPSGLSREIRAGADPNAQDQNGYTALMWLCRMHDNHFRERKRMFRSLVRRGASVNLLDTAGLDILAHALDGPERRFRRFVRAEVRRIRKAQRCAAGSKPGAALGRILPPPKDPSGPKADLASTFSRPS